MWCGVVATWGFGGRKGLREQRLPLGLRLAGRFLRFLQRQCSEPVSEAWH